MNALDPTLIMLICVGPALILFVGGIFLIDRVTRKKRKRLKMSEGAFRYFQTVANLSLMDLVVYIKQLDPKNEDDRDTLALLGGKGMFEAMAGHIFLRTAQRLRQERENSNV